MAARQGVNLREPTKILPGTAVGILESGHVGLFRDAATRGQRLTGIVHGSKRVRKGL